MLENVDLLAFGELWSQFSLVLATFAERAGQSGLAGSMRLNDLRLQVRQNLKKKKEKKKNDSDMDPYNKLGVGDFIRR